MLFATAILLQERREEPSATIKLVFQPNEEHAAVAREVEKTGVLSDVSLLWPVKPILKRLQAGWG